MPLVRGNVSLVVKAAKVTEDWHHFRKVQKP